MTRPKEYTTEFLISELRRFVHENGRNPKYRDMLPKFGYPSNITYINHFGSWNNALITTGLNINQTYEKRTGNEICSFCGNPKKENQYWFTKYAINGKLMCEKCYQKRYRNNDYINGILDVNSGVGFGFLTQRVVAKVLNLKLKDDCNCSINFGYPYDLFDVSKYGKIDVKGRKLNSRNAWQYGFLSEKQTDTYILVGFDENKKNILRVWIINKINKHIFKNRLVNISNNIRYGLKRAKQCEVDPTPYNDAFHSMSIENCSVLTYKE